MKPLQIFGTATKSRSDNATSQSLVNLYLEKNDDEKKSLVAYGTPGLLLFTDFGDTPVRGLYALGNTLYAVHRNGFYTVDNAGTRVLKGNLLTSSGFVDITDNGLQIFAVDGTNGYIYTIATGAFARVTDADFPGARTSTFQDSYFIVEKPDTGQFWLSNTYDGFNWVATNFTTAEYSPDNIIRVYANQGRLIVFGDLSIEFWVDTGALDFPYSRIPSSSSEWGLAARRSVAEINNSVMFLAKSRQGEVQVMWLNGYGLQRVSTFDIENKFNSYTTLSNATAFSYTYNGHPFYQINFNTESWLYDMASDKWSQLKSGTGRHRAEIGVTFLSSIKASDYSNGKIYTIDKNTFTDDGVLIVSELTTSHTFDGLDRTSISELQLDIESGSGTSNNVVMLEISKNNGHTFSNQRFSNIGAIGEYKNRARWLRLGQARDWVFKFSISDPIKRVILGAWIL